MGHVEATATPRARGRVRGAIATLPVMLAFWLAPVDAAAQFGRDAVTTRLLEIARRDAPSASPIGPVETGRLAQGQVATRVYRLQPGSCYWFLAVGEGNIHDIDVIVRLRGVQVVRDQASSREAVVPGERPYCPNEEQRVQVRVASARGGGIYATALYGREGDHAAGGTGDQASVGALLARAADRYATGMSRQGDPTIARLAGEETMTREVRLTGGMCYRVVAVGGSGVRDLELEMLQGSSQVAGDAATASEAVASYCATADTPVRIRLTMADGQGEVAWALFSGGTQHGARREDRDVEESFPVGGERDDYLARQIRSHHGRAGEERRGASEVLRAELRTSQDHSFPVRLEAGRCYTFIAVGAPSVRDLDIYLVDPNGMEVASETGPENHAVLHTSPCPRWSGTYTVRLRVFAGYGQVAVQAFGN